MRRLLPVCLLLASCVSANPRLGVEGGTGLKQGKADSCRSFREALLAREHVFVMFDHTRPGRALMDGTAKFSRHDKDPDRFGIREVRDKVGDLFERHAFQLVPEDSSRCSYAFYDEDLGKQFRMEIRRSSDDIVVGGPDEENGFKLSPFIQDPPKL